jgi:enoyl-CoA hydratase/carnithine racemase
MPEEPQTEDCVLAADRGAIRILTLNRPATRNAIDLELRVVFAEALEAAMADEADQADGYR